MEEIWEERYTLPVPRTSSALTSQWCRNKSEGSIYISDMSYSRLLGFFRIIDRFPDNSHQILKQIFYFLCVHLYRCRKFKIKKWQYYQIITQLFSAYAPSLILPTCLAHETGTTVCPSLPWGQVRFWAQLGRMMNNNWEMSRWVPESRLVLCVNEDCLQKGLQ